MRRFTAHGGAAGVCCPTKIGTIRSHSRLASTRADTTSGFLGSLDHDPVLVPQDVVGSPWGRQPSTTSPPSARGVSGSGTLGGTTTRRPIQISTGVDVISQYRSATQSLA